MPSYKNFQNDRVKNADNVNVFKRPKEIVTAHQMDEKRVNNIIDWCTFYRRNIHFFVSHYLGIRLYFFQIIWIYLMAVSDSFVAIASRADGKTWLLAVFACAKAILYPRSEIVVCSSTKEQAGLVVSDKITSLANDHPNLAREISNITTNMNKWQVDFHNGSVIRVVASRDSSRGRRSTFTIYEEFRLIDKLVVDAVIRPFSYIRQAPYLNLPEYASVPGLKEEPKEVFISSAYHKGLWWYDETKKNLAMMLKGEKCGVICLDYSLSILHNIKTAAQIKREKSKMDEITALEEYDNIPWGESTNAYFKLSMFEKARNIDKSFYPQRNDNYNPKKNPYGIPKQDDEIRILSCDIASRGGKANDLSVSSCIRLLPTHKGYKRELVYMESFSGKNSTLQALRIKQLWWDFEADYVVLDVATMGLSVYEQLGVVTHDPERDCDYPAMTSMTHSSLDAAKYEELLTHTSALNAVQVIYPISADAKMNSLIAVELRDKLQRKMIDMLVKDTDAETFLLQTNKEFADSKTEPDVRASFLQSYVQINLLVNECINLEMTLVGGNVKLETATSTARKDRYSSLSYGNYFASMLDQALLQEEDTGSDWEAIMGLTHGF